MINVNNCIRHAAMLIGIQLDEDLSDTDNSVNILLLCLNNVLSEIAEQYSFLTGEAKATITDGKISLSSLNSNVSEVTSVFRNGVKLNFTSYPDHIAVNSDGEVTVYYRYLPGKVNLDESVDFGGKITERIVAYGVAAEYYILEGMTDEAVIFDQKYRNALAVASSPRKEIRVRARRWL